MRLIKCTPTEALAACDRLLVKESYLFVCGGDTDKEEYKPILATYEGMAGFLSWKDRGILQTGGLDEQGAIEKSGLLEKAEEMGQSI